MEKLKIILADLDDIVFENRNKDYGAYDLRKRERRNLFRGAVITFSAFLLLLYGPYFYCNLIAGETLSPKVDNIMETVVILEDLNIPEMEEEESLEELEEIAAPLLERPEVEQLSLEFLEPNPVDDSELDDIASTITDVNELNAFEGQISNVTNLEGDFGYDMSMFDGIDDGTGTGILDDPGFGEEDDLGPDEFRMVEREPEAINMEKIKDLIGYPKMCKEAELQGRVVVRLKVSKSGLVKDAIVLRNPHPCLTNAVMNHVKGLIFMPALQADKPVMIWVNQEFNFTLTQ